MEGAGESGGSAGDGYLYETLDAFSVFQSTPDPLPTQSYSVLRTEISSSPPPAPPAAAPDYFSLESPKEKEDEGKEDEEEGQGGSPHSVAPSTATESVWFRSGCRFKSPMLQLHKEILDFCEFVSPTPEERSSRAAAVESVSGVIKYIWPHCSVEVFGSFKTGLYLPTSDIDVVILDSKVRTPQIGLQALSRALSQRGTAKKIQVIAKARVPIIKFVEKQSGVAFDISFDMQNGPKAAIFIKDAVRKLPSLRPLCLILKVFLHQRELNEVFSGGIGSYALLSMLIAQLRISYSGSMHLGRKHQASSGQRLSVDHNLGILLVDFFSLYGCKLNIWDVGVSCNKAGTFFLKSRKGFLNKDRPCLLSIEDPQDADNDIGKNSFNFFKMGGSKNCRLHAQYPPADAHNYKAEFRDLNTRGGEGIRSRRRRRRRRRRCRLPLSLPRPFCFSTTGMGMCSPSESSSTKSWIVHGVVIGAALAAAVGAHVALLRRGRTRVVGIIPARFASSRFHGKPLFPILGKPMIQRTWERAILAATLDHIVVATDDERIAECCRGFGADVMMTSVSCQNGTERCNEVLQRLKKKYDIVVNIQGDEPLIEPEIIDGVVKALQATPDAVFSTAVTSLKPDDALDPNRVKCVVDNRGYAIYFSRGLIPYNKTGQVNHSFPYLLHLGIQSYDANFLKIYPKLPPTALQLEEDLEQLKVLENGHKMKVIKVDHEAHGVDIPEDVERIEALMRERNMV